jgi:ABC-type glycerol-3-phosphate transport system substrate-binding protein
MFTKAGLTGPPQSFDEVLAFAQKMTGGEASSGFMTLNFDWLYWPLFAMNGVELVTPDLKKTAFNTAKAAEVLDKLAKATQSNAINKISWTGDPGDARSRSHAGLLRHA